MEVSGEIWGAGKTSNDAVIYDFITASTRKDSCASLCSDRLCILSPISTVHTRKALYSRPERNTSILFFFRHALALVIHSNILLKIAVKENRRCHVDINIWWTEVACQATTLSCSASKIKGVCEEYAKSTRVSHILRAAFSIHKTFMQWIT